MATQNGKITYDIDFNVNKNGLNELKNQLSEIQKMTMSDFLNSNKNINTSNMTNVSIDLQRMKETAKEVGSALDKAFNMKLGTVNIAKFNDILQKSDLNIEKIYKDFSQAGMAGRQAFRGLTTELLTTNLQLKETHSLIDKMAETMGNTIKWGISSRLMNSFTDSVSNAYNYVVKLDTSLNDIRIVTGKSAEEMERFAIQANKSSQALGASTRDYTEAALIYAQQGLGDKEIEARTKVTLMAANVTKQSTQEVSEQLTAVWNGYNVGAEETMLYIDKLSAVAASTAADLEELSTGMARVASAANLMGVDIDQLNAQLATIVSVTRLAPESIGTALRSIYARMSDIEAGIDEETSLGNYTEKMANLGVNVLNANGELRDMGEVIEEIGGKWNTMTREQQVSLAQTMAGTRQYNNLLALFENWDMYTEALNTSANAAGTLQEQQEIYMDSVDAHLQTLRTSWENVYDSMLDEESIKKVADALSVVANSIASIVDGIGGGVPLLTHLGALGMKVFGKQISGGIATAVINIKNFKDNTDQLEAKMNLMSRLKVLDLDAPTRQIVEMEEKILGFSQILTTEQMNEAQQIIKTTHELQKQVDAYEERKQKAQEFINQTAAPAEVKEGLTDINKMSQEDAETFFGKLLNTDPTQQGTLVKNENFLISYNKTIKEAIKKSEELKEEGNKTFEALKKGAKNAAEELQGFIEAGYFDENRNLIDEMFNVIDQYEAAFPEEGGEKGTREQFVVSKKLSSLLKETNDDVKKRAEESRNTVEKNINGMGENVKGVLKDSGKVFDEWLNKTQIQNKIYGITQLSSAITSYVGIYQTMANLPSIWKDEDTSTLEKVIATISALSTVVGQTASAYSSTIEVMKAYNKVKDKSIKKDQLETTTKNIDTAAQNANNVSKQTDVNLTKKDNIETLKNTGVTNANTAATNANTAATNAQAAANTALNASNPIGWISIALTLLVSILPVLSNLNKEQKTTRELIEDTREKYDELKSTLDNYNSGIDSLKGLTKGTLEWYDAIVKTNDAAQKLIDEFNLIIGQDYSIDANGMIQFNEKRLDENMFRQQQTIYQAQGIQNREIIEGYEEDLNKLYLDFTEKVNEAARKQGGVSLRANEAESILKGSSKIESTTKGRSFDSIMSQIQDFTVPQIQSDMKEFFTDPTEKVKESVQEAVGAILNNTVDITEAVKDFQADYNLLQTKKQESELRQADLNIRAYGTKEDIDQYNRMTSTEQRVVQDVVNQQQKGLRRKSSGEFNIVESWINSVNPVLGSILDLRRGEDSFSKGVVTESSFQTKALQTIFGPIAGTLLRKKEADENLDDKYKKWYEAQQRGYYYDPEKDEMRYSKEGAVLSEKQVEKLIENTAIKNARSAYEENSEATKSILSNTLQNMNNYRNIAAGMQTKSGNQRFDQESQNYIATAVEAYLKGSSQFNFQTLNKEELEATRSIVEQMSSTFPIAAERAKEFFDAIQPDEELRITNDLKNYNDELKRQAQELETTTTALKLYADAMTNANKDSKKDQSTARKAAELFKFNKTFNETVGLYEDNKKAYNDYIKAFKKKDFSKVTHEMVEKTGEVVDSLNQLFDTDMIDGDFLTKYEKQFDKLLNGSKKQAEKAYKEIRKGLINENIAPEIKQQLENIKIDTKNPIKFAEETLTLTNLKDQYSDFIDYISNTELKPGKVIDDEWSKWLIDFVNVSKMSTEEVNKLFSDLNLEVPKPNTENYEEPTVEYLPTPESSIRHVSTGIRNIDPTDPNGETEKFEYEWFEKTYASEVPFVKYDRNQKIKTKNKKTNFTKTDTTINKQKGKTSKKKEAKIKSEKDPYHDVNIELKQISHELDILNKQKDKLFGSDLIENSNKQLSLLNKQIETTNKKMRIAQNEAAKLRKKLSKQGVTFNEDGTISNYSDIYDKRLKKINNVTKKYNSMTAAQQKKYQKTYDKEKKNWEDFVNNINEYDETITDLIPGLESDLQDIADQKIEIQIEMFNKEIEIRLDMSEAEKDWNEFKKRIIDDIKEDDILGNARARLVDFSTYYNDEGTGDIQSLTRHINDILNQAAIQDADKTSPVYGKPEYRQQLLDDLKTYYDQLMEKMYEVEELREEMHEAYLDMLDEAQEKFDEQIESYETLRDLIDHDMNVIELIYGEESYSKLSKYYDKQEKNYNKQLDFQRQQVEFWRQQMDNMEEGSKEWENAREKWSSAVQELNGLIEESIENLQSKYLNSINEIFQNLNNEITGGLGLDYVSEEWDLINKNAERYLDTINATWDIQKLEKKYMDAYDQTDSISARRKIKDTMDQELALLREQDKLSQYDIDRANMRYDIMLKQIALQEAQQNKSQMRLRRDSQGNYSYQFVADQDEIGKLQEELGDLYNSLYNFDKEAYNENLNQIYDTWVEFQEKMAEAAQINDPAARAERELLLKQQYEELINGLTEDNLEIRNNLQDSAFEDSAFLYNKDIENFKNMTDTEKEAFMNDLVPSWDSGIQHMADTFSQRGGFLETCKEAFDKLTKATEDYENSLKNLQENAGINFEEIAKGIDEVLKQQEQLIKVNDDLIKEYEKEVEAIQKVVEELDELIKKYQKAKEEAIAATEAAYKHWQQTNKEGADDFREDQSQKGNTTTEMSSDRNNGNIPAYNKKDGKLQEEDLATYKGKYYLDPTGTAKVAIGEQYTGVTDGIRILDIMDNLPYGILIGTADRKKTLGWVKKSQLTGYDTGGYTGNWNGDKAGKLALLHEKELVLNKDDTKNILNTVRILRTATDMMNQNMYSRLNAIKAVAAPSNINSGPIEQMVHIEATFPGVKQAVEIENALNNLINSASQRVNRR